MYSNSCRRRRGAVLLLAVFLLSLCLGSFPALAQTVEQNVFDPVLDGDMSTVGNISITPNITSGDVYFESKVMFTGTDYKANLFRVRHNNNGSYGVYTANHS